MTTLKDKIKDLVIEFHNEVEPDPDALIEEIMETISDEIRNFVDRILM